MSGDPTKKSELPKGRFADASAVVLVGPRDCAPQAADAQTILTVFTLRAHLDELDRKMPRKQPLYIVAEILEAENVAHAKAAGADEVIETTRMGFSLLSHAVAYPGTAEVWSAIGAAGSQSLYVAPVPPEFADEHSFHLLAAQVKRASGALIIGLYDPIADKYHLNPKEGVYVPDGWKLLYLAPGPALPNE